MFRTTGTVSALSEGGLRSHGTEAFHDVVLGAVEAQKEVMLVELANMLECEHGASLGRITTFVGALRLAGTTVPVVLDGPMNGAAFLAYVQQMLAPTIRRGDTVIMDNLPADKVAAGAPASKPRAPACPLRPPYSPDFNLTENAFAKLKALLPIAAPSRTSGPPSPTPWRSSRQPNAPTTSPRAAMNRNERNLL